MRGRLVAKGLIFFKSFGNTRKRSKYNEKRRLRMFFKIGVLKNFAIFTGKHLSWSLFLINFNEKKLKQRCFPENLSKSISLYSSWNHQKTLGVSEWVSIFGHHKIKKYDCNQRHTTKHFTPKYIVKTKLNHIIIKKESWGVELYFLCGLFKKIIWDFFNFRKEIKES